ncbi:outer membrane protein assembly factor BamB family protein [Adhaeretor mobilis]|uniref:Outer membrane biogenesis protein BamB n=1 Tax=Adhaeretor mobilis TaxID=1930276 RepID=A0A517MXB8_9BACT|nr:PQQ-binding-like beta-propeller repeat protein [Adhaeretor mobilis]QDS99524.1 outer membrane biogenesis protein BamB [Adhaeretor mobilis]
MRQYFRTVNYRRASVSPLAFAVALLLCGASSKRVIAEDWLGFRGDSRSISETAQLPTDWSVDTCENIAWEVDLPGRGVSSPIVVDGRVVVTCSSGPREDRLHVIAFDQVSGKQLWKRNFWATGRTLCNATSAVAANTPVSDGERIYAFFSSNDLVALDLDGNVQWVRGLQLNFPQAGNDVGMSSSPVVSGGSVVVQSEALGASFVAAFDCRTGEMLWDLNRPLEATWSSPVALKVEKGRQFIDAVAVQSRTRLDVYAAQTGESLWSQEIECETIASCVSGDLLYVPSKGIKSYHVELESEETVKPQWQENRLQMGSPSPVIDGNRAFVINRSGVLKCGATDKAKGVKPWDLRLKGRFWATPVLTSEAIYCINSDGLAFVVSLGSKGSSKKGKIISKPDFGEAVLGSPAVADDAMFVRSHKHLWKISEK